MFNLSRRTVSRSLSTFLVLGIALAPAALVHASGTASIQSLYPGTSADAGSLVGFSVATSGFTNPFFQVSDSFPGTSLSINDINYYGGNVAWTPIASDVGTHIITVTIHDSQGNSATVTQQIQIYAAGTPGLAINYLTPGANVIAGEPVTFSALASGFKYSDPTFTIRDSFNGSTITSNSISGAGQVAWTPTAADVGTHMLTVTASDTSGATASTQLQIVVASANTVTTASGTMSVTTQSLSSPSATVGQPVTFTAVGNGFASPYFTLTDSFAGSTITSANINSSTGNFSWIPAASDVGSHTITIHATDPSGQSLITTQTIVVQGGGIAINNLSPSTTISAGTTLTFSAVSSNTATPLSYTLSDSFPGSTISNRDISGSGMFSWTPTISDIGTHSINVISTDATNHISDANLSVTVVSASAPVVTSTPVVTTTPSAPASHTFTAPLSAGLQSTDVTNLQNVLTSVGLYSGPITGYYGALTTAAVKAFQTAHGIRAVGYVGPQTIAALNQLGTTATTSPATTTPVTPPASATTFETLLSAGSTGAEVTALQNKLTSLGLYSGPITGYYGALTTGAVKAFQAAHNISTFGYTGPATRAALNSL